MRTFLLLFFGATFFYAGVLTVPHDLHLGIAISLFGLFWAIRPIFDIIRYVKVLQIHQKSVSFGDKKPTSRRGGHLRIVRPEEDEGRPPTIH